MSYIYIILAFFAPRLTILGGFFVYFSVLSLSPKLQNNYYEIWFTVMMCHQPSLIYNYLYKILVTFQFSTLQNCCCCLGGGGMCWYFNLVSTKNILILSDVLHMYSFSHIKNCFHKTKLDLHFTVFCKCNCKGFTTYMYKTLSGFFYVCFSITNTAFKRYV